MEHPDEGEVAEMNTDSRYDMEVWAGSEGERAAFNISSAILCGDYTPGALRAEREAVKAAVKAAHYAGLAKKAKKS